MAQQFTHGNYSDIHFIYGLCERITSREKHSKPKISPEMFNSGSFFPLKLENKVFENA